MSLDPVLDPADLALSRLERVRPKAGGGWIARCPAHDDRANSLSIDLNGSRDVLLKCFAGCPTDDVVKAMNLTMAALFATSGAGPRSSPRSSLVGDAANLKPQIVATYDYADSQGALLYQVVRYEPKDFRQRRPDGKGGWIWRMKDVPLLLYRRPQITGREAVLVVGGEKDADALWALGLPATTNSGGETKWGEVHTQQLTAAGVSRVVIIPDNDETGRKHADLVARSCTAAGITVRVLELPDVPAKGDVSDYLQSHSREDLIGLLKAAPAWVPPANEPDSPTAAAGPVVVCMADVQPEAIAWVWPQRLARGKLTLLLGDPGVGKSTLTLDLIARITQGSAWPDGGSAPAGNVVLLACEDGLADTVRPRLDRQGANPRRVLALQAVRDEHGQERHFSLERDLLQLRAVIDQHAPVALVIDPVSAYFGTERDSYKDTEVRAVLSPLVLLAEQTGTAIWGLVHPTKASQQKSLYRVMGSQGFAATARIVLGAGKDPQDERRCFLMGIKENICRRAATLAYEIGMDERLVWSTDPVHGITADSVMSGQAVMPDEDRDEAADFLRELLADGPLSTSDVERAGKGSGWSMPQLRRAQKRAGVRPEKLGFRGGWHWRLEADHAPKMAAEDDGNPPKMTLSREGVIFGENVAVSPLDSIPFSKITAPSSSASSSVSSSEAPSSSDAASDPDWGEV
jgi:putative DNA primase/helicase